MNRTERAYRTIVLFTRSLFRLFFRQVEIAGIENVPSSGGGLVVAWHPNGLVDPGLILACFPRRIVFGARDGLFKTPLLGRLMRAIGTVPIYRRKDAKAGQSEEERRAANGKSLEALAEAVAGGAFSALFPEGVSHDQPFLKEIKTGAARLFYQATEMAAAGDPKPVILPVGLHYDKKSLFGSKALVIFHPPVTLPEELIVPADDADDRRKQVTGLTGEIERSLRETVLATEDWELHHLMHRARKLIRAERSSRAGAKLDKPDMTERVLGFARLWSGYRVRLSSHPEETERLMLRVREYDRALGALRIEDHELEGNPLLSSPWHGVFLALTLVLVYLFIPPILVMGYLINLPPAILLHWVARAMAGKQKDEATIKILGGAVLFPLTWLVVAVLVAWGEQRLGRLFPTVLEAPWITGVIAFLMSALSGLVILRYQRLIFEFAHGVRVRLTRARRARAVLRLQAERARLFESLIGLAEGLSLPGRVTPEGRVVPRGK